MLTARVGGDTELETILATEAIALMASRLRKPRQNQLHLILALDAGSQAREKAISASELSRQVDALEPTLNLHGDRMKDTVDQFDANPVEITALFPHAWSGPSDNAT